MIRNDEVLDKKIIDVKENEKDKAQMKGQTLRNCELLKDILEGEVKLERKGKLKELDQNIFPT